MLRKGLEIDPPRLDLSPPTGLLLIAIMLGGVPMEPPPKGARLWLELWPAGIGAPGKNGPAVEEMRFQLGPKWKQLERNFDLKTRLSVYSKNIFFWGGES